MIKINLIHSAVENTNLDVVESAISNKGTQQTLLMLLALGSCLLAMGLDWYITRRDHTIVKGEVDTEQANADRLQQVTKQAKELQDKNKAVEERINAIMRLRADQTGPLRLLLLVDGKLPDDPMFRLTSLRQDSGNPGDAKAAAPAKPADPKAADNKDKKGETFTISGFSPNEAQVVAFAKNMEFADGWFTRFTIDTSRIPNPENKEAQGGPAKDAKAVVSKVPKDAIQFTIKCAYNPQNLLVNQATSAPPAGTQPVPPAPPVAKMP